MTMFERFDRALCVSAACLTGAAALCMTMVGAGRLAGYYRRSLARRPGMRLCPCRRQALRLMLFTPGLAVFLPPGCRCDFPACYLISGGVGVEDEERVS